MAAEKLFPSVIRVNIPFDSQISDQFLGAGFGCSKATQESMYVLEVHFIIKQDTTEN